MIHFCYVKLSGIALVVIWWKPHTHRIKDIRCRTRESLLRREGFQDVFNKEFKINILLALTSNLIYLLLSTIIFSTFFYIKEQNFLFTSIIVSTYFFWALQNLPNIRNIVLNKLDRNFYASLLVLISVGIGYFFIANAEYYIFSYLIGYVFSTTYLFSLSRRFCW